MDTWSRRKFLTTSGVVAAAALAAGTRAQGVEEFLGSGTPEAATGNTPVLVLVTLYGGNDGLNTVVPAWDKAYLAARPGLSFGANEVLPLGENLGLNPAMKGFKGLWDQKKLAIVRGVSYPRPDRSHFTSMSIWQTASPVHSVPSGWLGRWLDSQQKDDPLRAVSIGATLPPLLAGEKTAGAAVQLNGLNVQDPWKVVCNELAKAQAGVHPLQARAARSLGDMTTVAAAYGKKDEYETDQQQDPAEPREQKDEDAQAGASAGGQGQLGRQLAVVARAIAAGVPTRAYSVSLGGFDTHSNEKRTQAQLLGQMDRDISAFLNEIRSTPAGRRVVVAVYSEFGRRVKANASQGTDHGTAGPVFILGEPVKGGFYGEQPSLTRLDNGDLRMTTDFRDVYATLLERVLGTDPGKVLYGHKRTLNFI